MFNVGQFRDLNERVLSHIGLYSVEAVELLLGTCAVESRFGHYFKQKKGPALGFFQIEPATLIDIWEHYLYYKDELSYRIKQVCGVGESDMFSCETNIAYQICMARVYYLRQKGVIPVELKGQAEYWKKYYNTYLGKGTVEKYIDNYNRYVLRKGD
jgi:hypothetical protein